MSLKVICQVLTMQFSFHHLDHDSFRKAKNSFLKTKEFQFLQENHN